MTNAASDPVALQRVELMLDAGRYHEAVTSLRPMLAHAPDDVVVLTMLGRAHSGSRDLSAMLEVADVLIQVDPDGFFGHLLAADALFALGQQQRALDAASAAVRCAPDVAACHRMVAWTASEVPGRHTLAWDAASHAVAMDPLDADSHTCMGTVAMELHQDGVAERAFHEALRLEPGDALARHNLGVLRQRQGKLADAADHLLSSAALDPQQELIPRNLTAVVTRWLSRTHLMLFAAYIAYGLAEEALEQQPGFLWQGGAVLVADAAVVAWWTRRTIWRLGGPARRTMWRVVHRSVPSAAWFWALVITAAALTVTGISTDPQLRSAALKVALVSLIAGAVASWIGALTNRPRS